MLDNLRSASSSPAGKMVIGLLFGLLSLAFAISFGPGTRGCEGLRTPLNYAAKVNGEIITQTEFERYYYRRLRQLGDMDRQMIEQYFPRSRALEELIRDRLIAEQAGLRGVGVSDAELRALILKDPSFQEDDHFSSERYQLVVQRSLGLTADAYEEELRRDLKIAKMSTVLLESAKVTDKELEQAFRDETEKVDLTFVKFSPVFYQDQVQASDAEVAALLKDHADQVAAEYQKESYRFHLPKRVRARHLLLKVPAAGDATIEAKAREELAALRADIAKSAADFGDLIKKHSQAGDAATGGELGMVRENDHLFDPALEQAAMTLEVGKVSEVLRTKQGVELLQVTQILPKEDRPLEEVQKALAREMVVKDKELALAKAAAEQTLAKVAGGEQLDEIFPKIEAAKPGVPRPPPTHPTYDTTGPFARSGGGYIPKIGQSTELLDAAFALPVPGAAPKVPYRLVDTFVVVQLLSHQAPNMAEFTKKKDDLREAALRKEQGELMESWRSKLRSQAVVEINPTLLAAPKTQAL
jgi:peptidyl-prolyl cis-trans isomerase D